MMNTAWLPASHPDTAEPDWRPARPVLRDVACRLEPMLTAGSPFAIATVLNAAAECSELTGTARAWSWLYLAVSLV
jgi:hypothetical protein